MRMYSLSEGDVCLEKGSGGEQEVLKEGAERGVLDKKGLMNCMTCEQGREGGSREGSYNDWEKNSPAKWNSHGTDTEGEPAGHVQGTARRQHGWSE